MFKTDAVIIGAGVIGLAVARELAMSGLDVIVLEQESHFGAHTSSRNSEVIHAGIYYPENSLKAKFCLQGKSMLYQYCDKKQIEHARIGKYIVANQSPEREKLAAIHRQASENGVVDIQYVTTAKLKSTYPMIEAQEALWSPSTGIIDSHGLMLSMVGDIEDCGSSIAYQAKVQSIEKIDDHIKVITADGTVLSTRRLINAAGLWACELAKQMEESFYYEMKWVKGHYVSYSGRHPFKHLIYPIPVEFGLGTHLTLDLGGQLRLGPDTLAIDRIDYALDNPQSIVNSMFQQVKAYWPGIEFDKCQFSYSGIRPKAQLNGKPVNDFVIDYSAENQKEVVHLLGIESPGLTSCLALAQYVKTLLV